MRLNTNATTFALDEEIVEFTSDNNLAYYSICTCIEALNAGALKLTTTELIETYIPSIMRSAKPYFPPVLKKKTKNH